MVTKSKLKMALVADKNVDFKKEHQKKMAKNARKEQKNKKPQEDWEDVDSEASGQGEGEDDDESEDEASRKIDFAGIDDSDSDSEEEDVEGLAELAEMEAAEAAETSDEEDIPVSDLEDLDDEEKEDMIPHQRLTINNTTALTAALKRIALPVSKMSFSEHQTIVTAEPVVITDVSDDLNRELAFYAQSLSAVKEARTKLKAEGAPWSRPTDYFAEMVKADEHMAKIKAKLIDEAAGKKASAEARKQRDLKKFGKQVQVAKIQERDKERKQTMEKIKVLKRKRQGGDAPTEAGEADLFDVALEDATKDTKRDRRDAKGGNKRQKRDEKYGYGGKKRFAKSGDAQSSGDLRGFSSKKMKNQRPGKARRAGAKR